MVKFGIPFSFSLSLLFVYFSFATLHATVFRVDVSNQGLPGLDGSTRERAFATIQEALNACRPGDSVVVYPGVYFEFLMVKTRGLPDKPIRLLADRVEKNRVILTGAQRPLRCKGGPWDLVDKNLGLFRTPLPFVPTRVLADQVDLPYYPGVEDLKAFRFLLDDYPGHRHGFSWDKENRQLYVRLRADGTYGATDPREALMAVSPTTGGGKWGDEPNGMEGALIQVSAGDSANFVIDGLTFETPGWAAVLSDSSDLTVRNCWFFGCRSAVAGQRPKGGQTPVAHRVIVEQCFFTQYPAFCDIEDTIAREAVAQRKKSEWWQKIMHWQRKGGLPPRSGGVGAAHSYEAGFTRHMGNQWVVRSNHIVEAFEGLSSGSVSRSVDAMIYGNRFERLCDQAVETEDHSRGLRIFENLIVDVFEPFSWQPLDGAPFPGPVYIYDNFILQTPAVSALWEIAGNHGGAFKLGCKDDRNWEGGKMGEQPKDLTAAPGGFWAFHNTISLLRGQWFTSLNIPGRRYQGFYFVNNFVHVTGYSAAPGRTNRETSGLSLDHNLITTAMSNAENPQVLGAATGPFGAVLAGSNFLMGKIDGFSGAVPMANDVAASQCGLSERKFRHREGQSFDIPGCIPTRSLPGAVPFRHQVGPQARDAD